MAARRGSRRGTAKVSGEPKRKRPLATFTLSLEAVEMIAEMAEALGSSKSAVVERAVRELAARTIP